MLSTILLTLDGSPLAERAVPLATRLASATGARIVLVRVVETLEFPEMDPSEAEVAAATEAESYLARMAESLESTGLEIVPAVTYGDAPTAILDEARLRAANIIVMATHGRSGPGRWLYGSVADEVLRTSPVPVVVVPPACRGSWPADRKPRILVTLDESELSEAALAPTRELAEQLGADLILAEVVPWPPAIAYGEVLPPEMFDATEQTAEAQAYLDAVARRLDSRVGYVGTRVELGSPETMVARLAEQEHVDLIAMATHGRAGLPRLVLGSVATGTLQRASVPLLLIRPAALPRDLAQPQEAPTALGALPASQQR